MPDPKRRPSVHATATVRGGRLRLPAAVLAEFNLKDGEEVVFFIRSGKALLAPLGEQILHEPEW
jgi:bifunctional DNA-binding transcriptional regulator/antitoxin component of YhaV-PrlF toxin-antitoxin module